MKRVTAVFAVLVFSAGTCLAIMVTQFTDTDAFIARASDIVIARCVSVPKDWQSHNDNLYPASIEVLKVLKGSRSLGKRTVATIYPMEPGSTYMIATGNGMAFGTNYIAVAELAVVPLSPGSDLKTLEGKSLKEQVLQVFSWRRAVLEYKLRPLEEEKKALDRAIP